MTKMSSPEHLGGGLEKLGIIALFAGIIAVGASVFKSVFTPNKKNKEKKET